MEDWEKIIVDQRSRFDEIEEVPHEIIWQGISTQLKENKSPRKMWLAIAAGFALAVAAGMFLQKHQQNNANHLAAWESIPWEAEQERLVQMVNLKKEEIGFDTISAQQYPTVFTQLELQESLYTEILKDLEIYPDEDALLKILIKYHERQLKLLETLSREAKKKEIQHEKLLY